MMRILHLKSCCIGGFVFLIGFASLGAAEREPSGIPTWAFNLLFGNPIVVEADVVSGVAGSEKLVWANPKGGNIELFSFEIEIKNVLFVEHTIIQDSDFYDSIERGDVFKLKVFFEGDKKSISNIVSGPMILSFCDMLGIYVYTETWQCRNVKLIEELILKRQKIAMEWVSKRGLKTKPVGGGQKSAR